MCGNREHVFALHTNSWKKLFAWPKIYSYVRVNDVKYTTGYAGSEIVISYKMTLKMFVSKYLKILSFQSIVK